MMAYFTLIMTLNLVTYNCTGLVSESNCLFVREMLNKYDVDIAMLQETWLSSQTEHRIRNVHQDYMFTCMSAMCTREQ